MTRGRWIGVGITVVVLLLGVWIARNTEWTTITRPLPAKKEALENPFYAAQRLSEALGARTVWEHALSDTPPEAVVVVSGLHWSLIPSRRVAIERWVEGGGRLVVDGPLLADEDFSRWSRIGRRSPVDNDDILKPKPQERCRDLVDRSTKFKLCQYTGRSWITSERPALWTLRDDAGPQVMRVRVGKGTVTALNATPFGRTQLLEADHARLFVAATELRTDDDVHFISENETPSLIALIWRHGAPVVLLTAGWLALTLWRGGVRLGPVAPVPEAARRSLAEQIRGTAHFAWRVSDGAALHAATVGAVEEVAARRIASFRTLDADARASAMARLTTFDAASLSAALTIVDYRRTADLRSAIALLESARRQLQSRNTGRAHGTD